MQENLNWRKKAFSEHYFGTRTVKSHTGCIFLIKYNSCTQRAVSQTSTTIFRSYKTLCCVGVPSTQRHSCWKRLEQKLIIYGSRYVELNIDRVRIQLFSLLLNVHHFEKVPIDSRFPLCTWIAPTANPANQRLKASSSSILHRENEYFFAVTEPPQPTPVWNYWTKSWMDKPCCSHNNVKLLLVWLRLILLWHIFKKRLLNTVVLCANVALPAGGGLSEIMLTFDNSSVMYGFCSLKEPSAALPRYILINWVSRLGRMRGRGRGGSKRGTCTLS